MVLRLVTCNEVLPMTDYASSPILSYLWRVLDALTSKTSVFIKHSAILAPKWKLATVYCRCSHCECTNIIFNVRNGYFIVVFVVEYMWLYWEYQNKTTGLENTKHCLLHSTHLLNKLKLREMIKNVLKWWLHVLLKYYSVLFCCLCLIVTLFIF